MNIEPAIELMTYVSWALFTLIACVMLPAMYDALTDTIMNDESLGVAFFALLSPILILLACSVMVHYAPMASGLLMTIFLYRMTPKGRA